MNLNNNNILNATDNLKAVLFVMLLFLIGCGPFARLDTNEKEKDSPQPKLEKEYHRSRFWGGSRGIYVSIDKGSSSIGRQTYAKVKVMNHSGENLLLDPRNDRYWFERYGTKYSLYRRPGGRYPDKISDNRNIEFDLLGIDSFTAIDSITIMFFMMDSLEINSRLK
ncbi:hypothetical protein E3V55_01080 [Candidatus Marinimicrobia bacterium MT.SAG.3]|nr:hypothetical protein E3V55_01080 [Candidatus Marinimicrobia bacterium MT.SAG.3]